MTMRAFAVLLWIASPALAAPVPKEVKRPSDAIRIQGLWAYDTYDAGNGARGTSGRWYFEKEKMYSGGQNTTDKKGTAYGIVLRIDTTPSQMDITTDNGPLICNGIYKFDGDELHIAYVGNGVERPKDFASANGKTIIAFKRVPEEKK